MFLQHTTRLLEFCLKNTYFLFQGRYLEVVYGVTIGFPINRLIVHLFMEEVESKAISIAPNPPHFGSGMWMTHLSSSTHNMANRSSSTSTPLTPISNQHRKSQGHWLPTWTNTSSGTTSTPCQPSIVSLTHYHIGKRWYAPTNTCLGNKRITSGKPFLDVIIQHGH